MKSKLQKQEIIEQDKAMQKGANELVITYTLFYHM